jgi:hypothetical protein
LPHIKKVYETYRADPTVAFVLVTLDDDVKRLERYLAEMKFAMPVARGDRLVAENLFNVTDIPATFYIDRVGTIRYEARGLEPHGDADARISWYVEELKR